ncbi:thermostable carboxypeptidase 1 [Lasius niger]|uniref:Thermostable carboxypeptidase 1 n=1 Tax=Lasius niger TaxID=67767 RepID=A0A0J7K5I4_LASNI|nr:thermostable carboxypeptidase 1 [Lasius niger]
MGVSFAKAVLLGKAKIVKGKLRGEVSGRIASCRRNADTKGQRKALCKGMLKFRFNIEILGPSGACIAVNAILPATSIDRGNP